MILQLHEDIEKEQQGALAAGREEPDGKSINAERVEGETVEVSVSQVQVVEIDAAENMQTSGLSDTDLV
jgi:hypothetical protein